MATKFNDAQLKAIRSRKNEILISAGAGSGKSTVLVERLMQKILYENVDVDQFLIVTFTNLAAREMSEKLRESLLKFQLEEPLNKRIDKQLLKLPYAYISTFHGFCNKILAKYYYLVGLDVNFTIMEQTDADLLYHDILESFVDKKSSEVDFKYLIDILGNDRSDVALLELLGQIYKIARANPDMSEWLLNLDNIYELPEDTIDSWSRYQELTEYIRPMLDQALAHVKNATELAKLASTTIAHGYLEIAQEDELIILDIIDTLLNKKYDDVRVMLEYTKLSRFPALTKKMKEHWDESIHNAASDERKQVKVILDKIRDRFFSYTNTTHSIHFSKLKNDVRLLAKYVLEFHKVFVHEKITSSRIDYSDLELLTLEILENHPEVLTEISELFNEIMIDEYQDTNAMQERIVQLLAQSATIPMFMVGDVKQSIYRFRLADPSIFQGKYSDFRVGKENAEKIDLMQNYRSSRDVIDSTNYLFKTVMDEAVATIDYDEDAELKLGIENEPSMPFNTPEVFVLDKESIIENSDDYENFSSAEIEAHFIGKKIRSLIDEHSLIFDRKLESERLLEINDIVILLRNMTSAPVFFEILSLYNIPVSVETSGNLLEETEIITIISALKTIDNPFQDIPLVAILRSPLFFFTENELSEIRIANSQASFYDAMKAYLKNASNVAGSILIERNLSTDSIPMDRGLASSSTSIDHDLSTGSTPIDRPIIIGTTAIESDLKKLLYIKVENALSMIKSWRVASTTLKITQLIQQIYSDTSYLQFVLGLKGGALRRANLELLLQVADRFETRTLKGLYSFILYIDQLNVLGKTIPRATMESNIGGVKIMTIHKSKGLEFPVVFVSSIHKTFNIQDEIGNYVLHKDDGLGLQYIDANLRIKQKSIVVQFLAMKLHQEMLAEEMRLLYVALTRAKSKLILTGVLKDLQSTEKIKSIEIKKVYARLGAKRYIDWILPVVSQISVTNPWELTIINSLPITDEKETHTILKDNEFNKNLNEVFGRVYPLENLSKITAKQSVSQRKIEEDVPLFRGIPELRTGPAYDRPSFLNEDIKNTEVGTAFHQYMQHLPLVTNHSVESLNQLKKDLVEKQIIKESLAKSININEILKFTEHELYQDLLLSTTLLKELPFTMLFTEQSDVSVKPMLQGVIDLLAVFDDEVWIIDYKTDKVKNFGYEKLILRRRYKVQMKYYLQAMKNIFPNKKVIAKVYFVRVADVIEYK